MQKNGIFKEIKKKEFSAGVGISLNNIERFLATQGPGAPSQKSSPKRIQIRLSYQLIIIALCASFWLTLKIVIN